MNSNEIRRQSNCFLLLFSGLQMICSLHYDWDLASGRSNYNTKVGEKLFPTFKYGALSLFLNGFTFVDLIGLVTYIVACTKAKQTRIFYYHSLFFSLGMIISIFTLKSNHC